MSKHGWSVKELPETHAQDLALEIETKDSLIRIGCSEEWLENMAENILKEVSDNER